MDRTLWSCPIVLSRTGDSWSRHTPWGSARSWQNRCRDAMGPKAPDANRGGLAHGVLPPLSWKGKAHAPTPNLAGSHHKCLNKSAHPSTSTPSRPHWCTSTPATKCQHTTLPSVYQYPILQHPGVLERCCGKLKQDRGQIFTFYIST